MNMSMSIIIDMNIYIRPDLEEHLRKESSMSGLVNKLLHEHYDKLGRNIQRPVPQSFVERVEKIDKSFSSEPIWIDGILN